KETFQSALTRPGERLKIPPFLPGQGRNDLESAVTARYPGVAAQLAWLRKHRPQARLTGSGACVVGELGAEAEARALKSRLPEGMSGFVARGLEKHPLHDWID